MVWDYTLLIVGFGTALLGAVSGSLGSFAVLRKQSLLGDTIAHASLPGICLLFLMTQTQSTFSLLIGGIVAGWIGTLLVITIINKTRLKEDAALGIILSVFFGFGMVLMTIIQRLPQVNQVGLDHFLFGNASTLLQEDLINMIGFGSLALFLLILFWKEFKLLSFDPDYLISIGYPKKRIEILLTSLIVIGIIIGLQTVGVILMSAMIISPAAAARQWTNSLEKMVALAAFFGMISGVSGALISSSVNNLPTGPTIVCIMGIFVIISITLAPNRGLIWAWWRKKHANETMKENAMLENLLLFADNHENPFHAHDIAALTAIGRGPARKTLKRLEEKGFTYNPSGDHWAITQKGLDFAKENESLPQNYIRKYQNDN